jgi:hypothetical protein
LIAIAVVGAIYKRPLLLKVDALLKVEWLTRDAWLSIKALLGREDLAGINAKGCVAEFLGALI